MKIWKHVMLMALMSTVAYGGAAELEPVNTQAIATTLPDEVEPLSRIIQELNQRFGTDFSEEDRIFIQQLEDRVAGDSATISNGGICNQTAGSAISCTSITVTSGTFNQAAAANITVSGTLTIDGGTFAGTNQTITLGALALSSGTFTVTGGTINVSGDWTKSGGTFNYGTSTVVFNGSSAQTVSTSDT
jgi:hypothetical protein